MKYILVFLMLFVSPIAYAEPLCDRIFFSGISYHFDRENKHNESNSGIGCVKEFNEETRITLGTYQNSWWRQTVFVSMSYKYWHISENWSSIITGGLATGYTSDIIPAAFVEFRYDVTKKLDLSFALVPPAGGLSGVVGLYGTFAY